MLRIYAGAVALLVSTIVFVYLFAALLNSHNTFALWGAIILVVLIVPADALIVRHIINAVKQLDTSINDQGTNNE